MIKSVTGLLAIFCFVALASYAGISQAEPKLATESYMIPSRDSGIQLYVRNKRPESMTEFSPEKTLLYVHGTSQAASSTFDLPLDGFSWMDYIAQHGYDVYLVDVRGYGGSTRPPEMEKPAAENPPIVRTDVAVEDVAATVDHILARRGVTKLNLMGWSWGTTIMGRYATQNSDKVNRLVLYAPAWISEAPATGTQAPLGAYQTWTMEQARSRLQNGPAPEEKKKGGQHRHVEHGDLDQRGAGLVQAEKQNAPGEIQRQLDGEGGHLRGFQAGPSPGAPAGNRGEDLKRGPDRGKHAVGRRK